MEQSGEIRNEKLKMKMQNESADDDRPVKVPRYCGMVGN
jgi:hypothetical protein